MLIPYGTDTTIYHWPIATGILIVLNIVAYPIQWAIPPQESNDIAAVVVTCPESQGEFRKVAVTQFFLEEEPGWLPFALSHGEGLHPIQWFTSFFMHASIGHLIGNLIFLWAFGLVVEAKVGPAIFISSYLLIGIVQNALEQLIFLPFPADPSLGASSAIYGILILAMLFAPQDNLLCILIAFFPPFLLRPAFLEIPALIFALFYFLWDFGLALFAGFGMSTPLLHVMGGVVGFGFGIIMLQMGLVQTENRDLWSMILDAAGVDVSKRKKKISRKEKIEQQEREDQAQLDHLEGVKVAWKSFDSHMNAGNVMAAIKVYENLRRRAPNERWSEPRLLAVIRSFMATQDWDNVLTYSRKYLELFSKQKNTLCLNMAKIYIIEKGAPKKALRAIRELNANELRPQEIDLVKKLASKAKKMIADGVIELDD